MRFVEAGRLRLDRPVADVIPEFAAKGKAQVTLRDILIHVAGLKPITSGWPHRSWAEIVAKICEAPLKSNRGAESRAGYDPARSWFILGEMLQRIDGRPIERLIREEILEPIGMRDSWMAVPPHLYRAYGNRIGITYTMKDGELIPTTGHQPEVCSVPSPGGSMRGPARELGLCYELLLRDGRTSSGKKILNPQTVAEMTRRHREGLYDMTFQHRIDYGLGLIINSNRYGAETVPYGFGRHASETAFGHGGAQSSIGFADPEHELVVVAVANSCPGEELHNEQFRELNTAIYEDLGLAKSLRFGMKSPQDPR
jgi:CubicO group peptidase (beta-lactamase class C family)